MGRKDSSRVWGMAESEAGAIRIDPRYWVEGSGSPQGSVYRYGRTGSDGGAWWRLPNALHGRWHEVGATGRGHERRAGGSIRARGGRRKHGAPWCYPFGSTAGRRRWAVEAILPAALGRPSNVGGGADCCGCLRADCHAAGGGLHPASDIQISHWQPIESLVRCGCGMCRGVTHGATPCAGSHAVPERDPRRANEVSGRSGTNYTRRRLRIAPRSNCDVHHIAGRFTGDARLCGPPGICHGGLA